MPREDPTSEMTDDSEKEEKQHSTQKPELPYDPDQDLQEKREIRKHYRTLIEETNEQKQNLKNVKVSQIASGLAKGNQLFGRVKDTSEATLDSRYLIMASDMGAAKARAMKTDSGGFDVDDFVSKLITYMGGWKGLNKDQDESQEEGEEDDDEEDDDGDSPLDWEKVGRLALAKSRRVPVMDLMLGPLSVEQKQRTKVNRPKFEKNKEAERKPQELTENDIQRAENETTKNVVAITKLLRSLPGKINIFKFVVHPTDFGQTVENLFYLSFVIRDAECAFELDEHTGEPIIFSSITPTDDEYAGGLVKQQIVMELDMETWRRAVEVFDIKEPLIPSRQVAKMRIGDKWYG